jgi:peptide chain release factor subunit 1
MKPQENMLKLISEDLIPVTEIDIKSLAEIYDEEDIYLSIYLPVSGVDSERLNRLFINSRVKAIQKVLSSKLRAEFEKTFCMLEDFIYKTPISSEKGCILFACSSESFLHVYNLAVEPEQSMVLDTSPFLMPLAKLRADYDDYGMLLVDSQEARFMCIRSDLAEEKKHISIDLMNKHKKGGWSQTRFNHLRKGAIKSFFSELVDNVQNTCGELEIKGFVIAGPGNAKQEFAEMLPKDIQGKILGIVDLPMDVSRNKMLEAGDKILHESEDSDSKRRAEEFKTAILKGKLAVYGIEDVRNALENGSVNVLLILKDSSVPGWICERCQNLQANVKQAKECDRCGGPTSVVDVVEELYELAQRTGAEVEFVEKDDFLDSDDVVGALLRY